MLGMEKQKVLRDGRGKPIDEKACYYIQGGESLGICWQDEHCSEAIWNRAAALDPENCKPCTQNRDDFCFLCGEQFSVGASP